MSDGLPATLRLYRFVMTAAAPLTPRLLSYRLKRGKEDAARLRERYGEAGVSRPAGALVWVHGASVGELTAVLPLIQRLCAEGFAVLVTSGTTTSAELAQQRLPQGAIHQYVPLDVPAFAARFLDHWQPNLALFVESDLWPNLVLASAERKIPLVLVNGRLSQRSFARWEKIPRTIGAVLKRFDLCLAQSPGDAERYAKLGGRRVIMTGNLKLDVPAPPAEPAEVEALKAAIGDRPIIAAASTHAGEEAAVMDAHQRLRQRFPGLLTIVAPRHPHRGAGDRGTGAGFRPEAGIALTRRGARCEHRHLRRGHSGRTGSGLPHCADRVHGRIAGGAWRAKPDRAGEAWRRHPARSACLEFRRYLFRPRRGRAARRR